MKTTINVISTSSANNAVNFWEKNKEDSGIYLEFADFDKTRVTIADDFDGTIDDAVEYVKTVLFNAHI